MIFLALGSRYNNILLPSITYTMKTVSNVCLKSCSLLLKISCVRNIFLEQFLKYFLVNLVEDFKWCQENFYGAFSSLNIITN